jgi:hypothetical protein
MGPAELKGFRARLRRNIKAGIGCNRSGRGLKSRFDARLANG